MEEGSREQWAVRAPRTVAEAVRQGLVQHGTLDTSLRPRREEDFVLFPVLEWQEGTSRATFVQLRPIPSLPSHEMVGGIALLQEEDYPGAAQILAARPSLHTALFAESDVEGEFRTRRFTVLAGRPTTATTHIEYGIRFRIDLSKAYFSPRLATERQRLLSTVISGERVLDMFAGAGPFALTLARQASRVVAADLNPAAVRLMRENILLNRTANVLPVLADAACLPYILPGRFDRIVMNLPLNPVPFLPIAFNLCRPGGLIHCYVLVQEEGEILEAIHRHPVQHVRERYIRSYSAGRWHAVYDITVGGEVGQGRATGANLVP